MRFWFGTMLACGVGGLLALCFAPSCRADTWKLDHGMWSHVEAPTSQPTFDPVLDHAEDLLKQGDTKTARKVLVAWYKAHDRKAALADRCVYLLAVDSFRSDERIKAFYYCDQLMDEHPESGLYEDGLQMQFDIAMAYLNGYKDKFLFMRVVSRQDEAIQMLYRIQVRAPGSPLSEKALLNTADYYYRTQEYDEAEDVYNAYVRDYPNSPQVPRVKLHAAFASLAQFTGTKFDATSLIDARTQLVDIQNKYPDLAAEENVATVIDQIDSAFARKVLDTADFYHHVGQLPGEVYELRFLTQTYPNSPEAFTARQRLNAMPGWVMDTDKYPPPPQASGYSPSTDPNADVH